MTALSAIVFLSSVLWAASRRQTFPNHYHTSTLTEDSFIEESAEDNLACCTGDNCYGRSCCAGHRRYSNGFGTVKCIPRKVTTANSTEGSFVDEGAEAASACCTGDNCYGRSCCAGHRRYGNGFGTVKCIPRKVTTANSTEGSFVDEAAEAS